MTTIVGIDPSLTSTGIAMAHPATHPDGAPDRDIETYRVRSKGGKDDTWEMRAARMNILTHKIVVDVPQGSLVLIESPSYGSVGGSQHDRSGLWWMVYHELREKLCHVVPVTPQQRIVYALGKGAGKDTGKDNVLAAVIKQYSDIEITGNDVADAVILMAMGLRLVGEPIDEVPQTHLRALEKIPRPNHSISNR